MKRSTDVAVQLFSEGGYFWLSMIQEGFTEVLIVDLGPKNWAQSGLPMMAELF